MSKSARIRASEFRAILETVGECRDLGDDPVIWRDHLCQRVALLTGADVAFCGEISSVRSGRITVHGAVDWGLDCGFDRTIWDECIHAFAVNPRHQPMFVAALARLIRSDSPISMGQMLGDRGWRRSYLYQEVYANVGLDANLYSLVRLNCGADDDAMLFVVRAAGRRAFGGREGQIVREIKSALAAGIGGPFARFTEPSPSKLTPRARQVLKCLLEGDGDKQVAIRLALSPYTVNQYTKVIYRHFGASSRTELLARWVRRGWGATVRWAD
jgi:DNA-binding CsgD family transcriptional regulator